MANSVDPDMPYSLASDQDLHCLQRPICPSNLGCYGTCTYFIRSCSQINNLTRSPCLFTLFEIKYTCALAIKDTI